MAIAQVIMKVVKMKGFRHVGLLVVTNGLSILMGVNPAYALSL